MNLLAATDTFTVLVNLGAVIAVLAPIFGFLVHMRNENTRQHEDGRKERIESEARLTTAIDGAVAEAQRNGRRISEVRERLASVEANQDWLTQGVRNLPAFQDQTTD